jgi:hypothetical protein
MHLRLKTVLVAVLSAPMAVYSSPAQDAMHVQVIAPNLIIFPTTSGNVVTSVGKDGALLIGTPSATSTSSIRHILDSKTTSSIRYVVIAPEELKHSNGDAGWGRQGAFVAMQENALGRLGGHTMGAPAPLPPQLVKLGVDRPRISFSDVLSFDLNGEAIHVVHQPAAYSDADCVVHFHVANLVYLGEVFPGDGYPMVDLAAGGNLSGIITMLKPWTDSTLRVVPARGEITNGSTVKAFLDMLMTVRDRVQHLVESGETEEQVIAAKPSKDFDAQWGNGRVSPDAFAGEVYTAVSTAKGKAIKAH